MNQYLSYRNLRFIIFEMLEADKLNRFPRFADYDRDAFEMALDAAKQISDTHLFPFYMEMIEKKPILKMAPSKRIHNSKS